MNLKNGYKVVYEKAADGKRVFYASKTGLFADAEQLGEEFEIGKYKLIYEKDGKFYGSETGIPAYDENGIPTDKHFDAFDKVFVEAEGEQEEVTNTQDIQGNEPGAQNVDTVEPTKGTTATEDETEPSNEENTDEGSAE